MPPRAHQAEHAGLRTAAGDSCALELLAGGSGGRTSPRPSEVCRFGSSADGGDVVDPGPAFGQVHRTCFTAWDREQEAHELEFARAASIPLPDLLELEEDPGLAGTAARAA